MKNRLTNILLILSIICVFACEEHVSGPEFPLEQSDELSADVYEVYSRVLNQEFEINHIVLAQKAQLSVKLSNDDWTHDYFKRADADFDASLVELHQQTNEFVKMLGKEFVGESKDIVILSPAEVNHLFDGQNNDDWSNFKNKYPGVNGIVQLSNVVFNESLTQAVFELEYSSSVFEKVRRIYFLKKSNGEWLTKSQVNENTVPIFYLKEPGDVSADEYILYSKVIDQLFTNQQVVIRQVARLKPELTFESWYYNYLSYYYDTFDQALVQQHYDNNQNYVLLGDNFESSNNAVSLLTTEEEVYLLSNSSSRWELFNKVYSNASGILTFSRVTLKDDRSVAVLEAGLMYNDDTKGYSEFLFFAEKQGENWVISEEINESTQPFFLLDEPTNIPQEDYDIYNLVLNEHFDNDYLLIPQSSKTETFFKQGLTHYETFIGMYPQFDEALIQGLENLNSSASRFADQFERSKGEIDLISAEEVNYLASSGDFWEKLDDSYPGAEAFVHFSRIEFNSNQTQSVFEMTYSQEGVSKRYFVYLIKEEQVWNIEVIVYVP